MKKGSLADLAAPVQIGASIVLRDNVRLRRQLASARERIRELECLCVEGADVKKVCAGQVWCDLGMSDLLRFYKVEQVVQPIAFVRRCTVKGETLTNSANKVAIVRVRLTQLISSGDWVLVKEAE